MKERAYAKINLCLDVVGKRASDGYHELKMIMVPIDFYDVLEMEPAAETSLSLNRSYLPVNGKNTIIKAITVMKNRYGFSENYACILQKHIPTRAGLAGGSADAAAAIRMMNSMLGLHLSNNELIEIGQEVGSDVPFCLLNQPAYVEGTGEKIEPFYCHPNLELLLVKPRRGVSTKEAFQIVDQGNDVHPDCMAMKEALMMDDYEGIIRNLGNSLEAASLQLVPEIKRIKEQMKEAGFDGVLMSGSGSTVFGIAKEDALLEQTMKKMKAEGYFVRRTKILSGGR
ncbi:MAG: 4-(cytidine 5'-diphospho)-2-C-methyl-D-erythritol kinase [Solobacterium sp.]|jgi:4-diphosphocytidyl-2-C-methyl-D-erythritol kinase|nr:4-(cytidine 5'-diphospho)-2-C-methyl-D-erythritol kinase [Solobacterium sp.]MCH4227880.1 4-(cytidine 5'-diphospho)-2-C-methyl-D-erythritol kinase [Solobacterium sp.]MCH4283297.1 4-(cytidine 5'-diphospho)-2-C-methyl-D-erythritol kinase [Solobacterium sp.]